MSPVFSLRVAEQAWRKGGVVGKGAIAVVNRIGTDQDGQTFLVALPRQPGSHQLIGDCFPDNMAVSGDGSLSINIVFAIIASLSALNFVCAIDCGLGAIVLMPEIGHTAGLGGLSVLAIPEAKFVVQLALCQSGELSLCTPKFDAPTTSR